MQAFAGKLWYCHTGLLHLRFLSPLFTNHGWGMGESKGVAVYSGLPALVESPHPL